MSFHTIGTVRLYNCLFIQILKRTYTILIRHIAFFPKDFHKLQNYTLYIPYIFVLHLNIIYYKYMRIIVYLIKR